MKLPFTFGNRLLFRLVLPGLLLALSVAPGFEAVLRVISGHDGNPAIYLPFLTVFLGWLIILADMRIYMLFEGRRFWPKALFSWALNRERDRLQRLQAEARIAHESGDSHTSLEKEIDASLFPLNSNGERYAALPTRLGNIIYEYEFYPKNKYGLDSVFFFYRIWISIDDSLRNEVDSQQAVVDGAIYISLIFGISAAIMLGYSFIEFWGPGTIPWLGLWWLYLCLALVCILASRMVYVLSLSAHVQYGELYKSLFDQYRSKINMDDVLKFLNEMTGNQVDAGADFRESNMAIWRYLRWHRIRLLGEQKNENIESVIMRRYNDIIKTERVTAGEDD